MHFYLLNPTVGYVTRVTGKPTLEQIYEMLECTLIDVVRLQGTSDVLICDDEGLYANTHFNDVNQSGILHIDGMFDRVIAGSVLYVGSGPEGEFVEPEHTFSFMGVGRDFHPHHIIADPDKSVVCKIKPQERIQVNYKGRDVLAWAEGFFIPTWLLNSDSKEKTVKETITFVNQTDELRISYQRLSN